MKLAAASLSLVLLVACSAAKEEAATPPPSAPSSDAALTDEGDRARARHRSKPRDEKVVYYRLHPQEKKVDRYCGALDRSYVVSHVDVGSDRGVLRRALQALFAEYWGASRTLGDVSIDQGRAVVDLRSTEQVQFASTSCGGVGFLGSMLRTVFQFDHIEQAQLRLRGSCRDFGEFMQSGVCRAFEREDISPGD